MSYCVGEHKLYKSDTMLIRISYTVLFIVFHLLSLSAETYSMPKLRFKHLSANEGLPTDEVRHIFQDSDGYIWISTNSGLCCYDGYQIKTYKSNFHTPGLLNNNNIYSVAEDQHHRIWIAAYNGVNILDKTTGSIREIEHREFQRSIVDRILITKDERAFIGTQDGVYEYFIETDSCIRFKAGELAGSVKSMIEDSKGHIWIGTWSNGLYRYDPIEDQLYDYPQMNPRNSAYTIFEDNKQRIWIGSWGYGLFLLDNPYDLTSVSWKQFKYISGNDHSLCDDIILSINEDLNTNTLWIGTRNGLSLLKDEKQPLFINYRPDGTASSLYYNEVNSIIRDSEGMMWLGLLGGGVNTAFTRKPEFKLDRLEAVKNSLITNSAIRGILVDKDGLIWLGLGSWGFFIHNRLNDKYIHNMDHPDFSSLGRLPIINTIYQSPSSGKILLGSYDWGLIVYDKQAESGKRTSMIDYDTAPWLTNQCVFSIYEDSRQHTWLGTRNGICVLLKSGKGVRFDSYKIKDTPINAYSYLSIVQDESGNIWTGTNNGGIIKITGSPDRPEDLVFEQYAIEGGKLNSMSVPCLFIDSRNRLWAGTEGGGLSLYDSASDRFVPVHRDGNLPGDAVFSLLEDQMGNLWMGTNVGLMKVYIPEAIDSMTYRLYTVADGLQNNIFYRNTAFKDINGEMFFGGYQGYNSFFPDRMVEDDAFPALAITDFKVHNQSWNSFSQEQKKEMSVYAPDYMEHIKLNYKQNNFAFEFAALSFSRPQQINYAFQLDGFDKDWQYAEANRHFAYYNNLYPGTYHFRVKSTNASGAWSDQSREVTVTILPPPWKSNLAYLCYLIFLLLVAYTVYRFVRYRISLRNTLQLQALEYAKAEEVNHSKLQFFTNITHELLTPLTILSASVDELRQTTSYKEELYPVMTNNINRLIRLLQQILEFRKAESGNLQLRVSENNLTVFTRNSVDSFRPLIKKKLLSLTFNASDEDIYGYFDSDKLDKILYNLLSNAAKYNHAGGQIEVSLKMVDNGIVQLIVSDNGDGISQDAAHQLFQRFYEGDYRKFNTIGTGIGLSLTKDLILLHKGSIDVSSENGKGTAFIITLPISRANYKEAELDNTSDLIVQSDNPASEIGEIPENDTLPDLTGIQDQSLLVIEDNDDLQGLMVRLLSSSYRVFTASTGKEGLEIIKNQEVDLIVSDVMMPEMDGYEFCRIMKDSIETCHIPIILLTAKNREEDRVAAYNAGADGYISKPFNLEVLQAKISNLLKQKVRVSRDFKKQLTFETSELNYTSLDETFLQQAIDCIHRHLSDPMFDQQIFLNEMGTSKSTLYRKLKSLTGLNSSAFIRNIRLKAACRIMEEKQHIRISELAYAVGFNDPKYFSVCFKKEFGIQPSEYLEKYLSGLNYSSKTDTKQD